MALNPEHEPRASQPIITEATEEDREQIIQLLTHMDKRFIPALSERTTIEGYYEYLRGVNSAYIQEKYGLDTPLPRGATLLVAKDEAGSVLGVSAYFEYFQPFNGAYVVSCVSQQPGVGSRLISRTMSRLEERGVSQAWATTWTDNLASQAIMKRMGFQLDHAVPNERGEGIDGLYFCKVFSPPPAEPV